MSARPKSPDVGDVHLSRSVLDRLGALVREMREDIGESQEEYNLIQGCADKIEAALAAQPAPAVMGEGDALFKLSRQVAADYSKHAGSDDLCELESEECLADFLYRALAGRTAAAESREEPHDEEGCGWRETAEQWKGSALKWQLEICEALGLPPTARVDVLKRIKQLRPRQPGESPT